MLHHISVCSGGHYVRGDYGLIHYCHDLTGNYILVSKPIITYHNLHDVVRKEVDEQLNEMCKGKSTIGVSHMTLLFQL